MTNRPRVAVCFVCLGNICRSPTAEGVFRHLVEQEGLSSFIHIDSAGTGGYHVGESADKRSMAFAARRGYRLLSIARKFDVQDFHRFDYVLAMDQKNLAELLELKRRSRVQSGHLGLFRAFDASAPQGAAVPDPYYGGDAGFEEVLDQCERACRGFIAHLRAHELRGV